MEPLWRAPAAYPVVMIVSIGVCVWLSRRSQRDLPLDAATRWKLAFGAFTGAMLGAKLPFALLGPEGVFSASSWFVHGKTIVAGLVGGYAGVEIVKAAAGVRVKTGDAFAAPVAVGIGLGRFGCFVGGCCYGTPTSLPWAMEFAGALRHPTQLYEMGFHLSAAAVLYRLRAKGLFRFQLMKLYILSYLAYRFATEFIRPEPVWAFGLTAYQVFALGLMPAFGWLWLRDREWAYA